MTESVDNELSDDFEDWQALALTHAKEAYPHWDENMVNRFASDVAWSNEGLVVSDENVTAAYASWLNGSNPYSPFSSTGENLSLAEFMNNLPADDIEALVNKA